MKDQRGVVYLETLVAFLPVFLFFLATLQIADLSAAHIIVRHAATVAARAAVVVMPDDGRYYNDESNQQLHSFDGLRRQDIEHAADLILRTNPRLDKAPSNVVVSFQNPPSPQPPSPGFECKGCSREEVLAKALDSQTARDVLDTSTKGEVDWGMREKLDALVTAKYRCMLSFFCPRDFTLAASASLLYQGARYTYEAWPDSIRSDGRTQQTPAGPVGPPTPGSNSPTPNTPPTTGPNGPVASNPPSTNPTAPTGSPGSTGPVASNSPTTGSTDPNGSNSPTTGSTNPGGSTTPTTGSSGPVASNSPTTGSSGPVASNSPSTGSTSPSGSNSPTTGSSGPSGSNSPTTGSSGPVASNSPNTNSNNGVASNSPNTNSNNGVASNSPNTSSNNEVASNSPNTSSNNGVASNSPSLSPTPPVGAVAPGSTTATSGARPTIVAREPADSDGLASVTPSRSGSVSPSASTAADSSSSSAHNPQGTHAAATPTTPSDAAPGAAQSGTSTTTNGQATASNPTRGPAPTRGPPGANTNSSSDTRAVIAGAVNANENEGSSPTLGRNGANTNTPSSTASIIASGPEATQHAANAANRGRTTPQNLRELRAQLPADMRDVPIVRDPSLSGNTVRAHYTYDARGRVTSVELRVGPNAQARHIADHVDTVRALQRYQGLSGRVRLVLAKLNAWIAGHPDIRPGSLAWETRREVEKLQAIIEARTRALDGAQLTATQRAELENERREYERQLSQHEQNLNHIINEPGRGYIAAEDTGSAARAAAERAINAQRAARGEPPIRVPDAPPGYHWRLQNGLPIVARNRIVAGRSPRQFDPDAKPDPNDPYAQFPERPGIVSAEYVRDSNGDPIVDRIRPTDDVETLSNERQQIADEKLRELLALRRLAQRLGGFDLELLKGADGAKAIQEELNRAAQRLGFDLSQLADMETQQQILAASSGRTTGPLARNDAKRLLLLKELQYAQAQYKRAELELTQASERLGSDMAEHYMAERYPDFTQSYPAHPPGHPYEPGKSGEFDFVYTRGTPTSEIIIVEAKGAGGKLTSAGGYEQGSPDYVRHIAAMMAFKDPANAEMWKAIAGNTAAAPKVRYLHATAPLKENTPKKDSIPWLGEIREFDLSDAP